MERVPSHISAIFPLRPISPMESAIHDVRCAVTARATTWLTIDLAVILVSLVIIGLGMWLAPW